MRFDRDTLVIGLTLVPLALLGLMYLTFQATGQWPGWVPSWVAIPSLPAVSLPTDQIPYVADVRRTVQNSGNNVLEIGIGFAVGLVAAIFIIGGGYDLVRWIQRTVRQSHKSGGNRAV